MFEKIKNEIKKQKAFLFAELILMAVFFLVLTYSGVTIHPALADAWNCPSVYRAFQILMILLFLFLSFIAFSFFGKREKKVSPIKMSLLSVAVFGLLFMLVLPPMTVPDEIRHFAAAYRMSNIMMGQTPGEGEYVYFRAEDITPVLNDFPGYQDYLVMLTEWRGAVDSTPVLYTKETVSPGFHLEYLPQAIGITLGRLLHLRQLPLWMLARMCNFITWFILLAWAVRLIPFGKEVLLIAALLPMGLQQEMSLSYDAMILGLSAYFIAYVLYLAFEASQVRKRDMAALTISMAILAPIKLVYVLLAFLCFMIPKEKFGSAKKYWLSALAMLAVVGSYFLFMRLGKLVSYVQETDTSLGSGDLHGYTMSWLLSHPKEFIKLIFNTINMQTGDWIRQMTANSFGWLEIQINNIGVYAYIIILAAAAIRPASEPVYWKTWHKVLAAILIIAVSGLIMSSMAMASTPMGYAYIRGIQGRYFLPLLPLALLAARNNRIRREGDSGNICIYAACLVNVITAAAIIAVIVSRTGVLNSYPIYVP